MSNHRRNQDSSSAEKPACHYFFIVIAPHIGRVLIHRFESHAALPHLTASAGHDWFETDHINKMVARKLGLTVTVLRCLRGNGNNVISNLRVYELEHHGTYDPLPEGYEWIRASDISRLNLADKRQRSWLAEQQGSESKPAGLVWNQPGWITSAVDYAGEVLQDNQAGVVESYQQLRAWERSCVLRLHTADNSFILKASPPMYEHEPRVMRWLSRRYPGQFPQTLTLDGNRHAETLLMEDIQFPELSRSIDIAVWRISLQQMARIQTDLISESQKLLELGVPDLGLAWMRSKIDLLCSDTQAMLIGQEDGLTEQEALLVNELASPLHKLCDELMAQPIPESFEHGDFRPSNIMYQEPRCIFIDVSNSAISHPFFSAITLLDFEDLACGANNDAEEKSMLRDAYLWCWRAYAPTEVLMQTYETARPLAILYSVLVRRYWILPQIDNPQNWQFMIPYWLKQLIHAIHHNSSDK